MLTTGLSAIPAAVPAPVTAVVAVVDGQLLLAALWAGMAVAAAAIVRSCLIHRGRRRTPVRIVTGGPGRRAA